MAGNNFRKLKLPSLKLWRIEEGFSLIELMVSVALFSVIIIAATQIFKLVVDAQRGAMATQNVEESLKYFSEVTGKEMRMALKNPINPCPGISPTQIFVASDNGDRLIFQNRYGECVTYQLEPDENGQQRFQITRGTNFDFITPAKIKIDTLKFKVSAEESTQPMVTLNLKAYATGQGQFKSDMTIQTSITSRYYK